MIVITTESDGTLKENISMRKWISGRQKPVRKTVTSQHHPTDIGGGGRDIFSNANGDVPMSNNRGTQQAGQCEMRLRVLNQRK